LSLKSVKTLTAAQLAKKWDMSLDEVKRLIAQGAAVEREHTDSRKDALEIARDHLSERPDYYKKLAKLEKTKITKEGMSTEPERDSETIGDYTGSSRKVMKVDEVKIPPKVKKAAATGMTLANLATLGQVAGDAAEGRKGSDPKRGLVAATSTLPGPVGWGATGLNYTIKGYDKAREHLRSKVKQMKEEQINELDTSSMSSSKNIIDKRPGLSVQGIRNTIDTFKQNMALRSSKTGMPELYGNNASMRRGPDLGDSAIPVQSKTSAAIGSAIDTAKSIGNTYKDRLGLGMDKPGTTLAKDVARTVAPVASAVASTAYNKLKPSPNINPSTLPASKASPTSISTVGGASSPNLGSDSTPKDAGNFIDDLESKTPSSRRTGSVTPKTNDAASITDVINATDKEKQTKTPSQMNEISAELVGKVSNARFWQGKAPSKTLTRAINKKFIEIGKKDKANTKKEVKEETTMDTKELINEALDDILDNNLVNMKENFLAALQEKAMERLEEKKKEIASNYFAQ
jgi:hypothetical protein